VRLPNPVREVRTIDRLLTGAEAQARRLGDDLPGAEHLVLSALELPDGTARAAFARVGADPDAFADAITAQHAAALRAVGISVAAAPVPPVPPEPVRSGPLRTDASCRAAFQEAVRLARSERPSRLRGAHVLLAVAGMEHGTAARALEGMGVARDALAAAARTELGAAPA
jgi:ATP-dependent Clp protease ATP-binding subunit ClpA